MPFLRLRIATPAFDSLLFTGPGECRIEGDLPSWPFELGYRRLGSDPTVVCQG